MSPRIYASVVVATCLLASCSGSADHNESSASSPPAGVSLADSKGDLDINTLLGVFAGRASGLPGVKAITTGTDAITDEALTESLAAALPELPAADRAAVTAWLLPGPPTATADIEVKGAAYTVTPAGKGSAPAATAGFGSSRHALPRVDEALVNQIGSYLAQYNRHAGTSLTFTVEAAVGPTHHGNIAESIPPEQPTDPPCRITVGPDAASGYDSQFAIAHEAFHCWQYAYRQANGISPLRVPRLWVREATAMFAAAEVTSTSSTRLRESLAAYAAHPELDYERRNEYDDVGMLLAFQEGGADMWTIDNALLLAAGPEATLAHQVPTTAIQHWAAAFVGRPTLGDQWVLAAYTHELAVPEILFPLQWSVPAEATVQGSAHRTGDVLIVGSDVPGTAHIGSTDLLIAPGSTDTVCITPLGCEPCPGDAIGIATQALETGPLWIAGGSLGSAGTMTAEFITHDEWCRRRPAAPTTTTAAPFSGSGRCVVGTWRSTMITLSGLPQGLTVSPGGSAIANFHADGTFDGGPNDVTISGQIGGTPVTGSLAGDFHGTWSGDGTTSLVMSTSGSAVVTITIAGATTQFPLSNLMAGNPSLFGSGTYSIGCNSTTLVVTSSAGTTNQMTRVAATP